MGFDQLDDSNNSSPRLCSGATNIKSKQGVRALASAFDALAIQATQKASRTNNIQLNAAKTPWFKRNVAAASSVPSPMPYIKPTSPITSLRASKATNLHRPGLTTVAQTLTFQSLTPELHILIFEILPANSSTCLGLTCKQFYAHHKAINGTVPLYNAAETKPQLHELLHPWFGFDLYFYQGCGKFLTLERFAVKLGEEVELSKEKYQRALDGILRTTDELQSMVDLLRQIVATLPNYLQMPAGNP